MSINTPAPPRTITDPVVMFDSMWEAANSLFGSFVWLSDHADSPEESERWWAQALEVHRRRAAISATDMDEQWAALLAFRKEEQALDHLIDV